MMTGKEWLAGNWKALLGVLITLMTLAGGYFVLRYKVDDNRSDIEKHGVQINDMKTNQIILTEDINDIHGDVDEINETLDDMEEEQQETHDLLIRVGQELGVDP